MQKYDLYLLDEEYETNQKKILEYADEFEAELEIYCNVLTYITENVLISGNAHDALVTFNGFATQLKGTFSEVALKYGTISSAFVGDVMEADKVLYIDGNRDYREEQYELLMSCLDDPWCELTDQMGDYVTGFVFKALNGIGDLFHWKALKEKLSSMHGWILDQNDVQKEQLRDIFETVNAMDKQRAVYLDEGELVIDGIVNVLNNMASLINGSEFTAANLQTKLTGAFKEMNERIAKFISVPEHDTPEDIETVRIFASQNWAEDAFGSTRVAILGFFDSRLGLDDTIKSVIFEASTIGTRKLSALTLASFVHQHPELSILLQTCGIDIETDLWYIISEDDSYERLLVRKQLWSEFSDMMNANEYDDYFEILSILKKADKEAKQLGQDLYDYLNTHRRADGSLYLDGRTIPAKKFNRILDGLDNAGKILKYGTIGVEYVAKLVADYEKGFAILDALEGNCPPGSMMAEEIAKIRELYEKKADSWITEFWEADGKEISADLLMGSNPYTKGAQAVLGVLDTIGDATGIGSETKAQYEVMVMYNNIYSEAETTYQHALAKLQAADPSDPDYAVLSENFVTSFNFRKKTLLDMFEKMGEASHGTEKGYYDYCCRVVQQYNLGSDSSLELMSQEEYEKAFLSN